MLGNKPTKKYNAGIAQLVERNLAKVEVASSSLVSRSRFQKAPNKLGAFFSSMQEVIGLRHKTDY